MRSIQISKPSNRVNNQFVYNLVKQNTIFCPLLLRIFLDQPVTYNELHSYVNLTRKLKLPPTIYAFIYIKQFSISFRAVTAYMYIYHVPRKPTTPLAYYKDFFWYIFRSIEKCRIWFGYILNFSQICNGKRESNGVLPCIWVRI